MVWTCGRSWDAYKLTLTTRHRNVGVLPGGFRDVGATGDRIPRWRIATVGLWIGVTLAGPLVASDWVHPRVILQTGHGGRAASSVAWTPDSQFVVTGSDDRQLIVWDRSGAIVDRVRLPPNDWSSATVDALIARPDGVTAFGTSMPYSRTFTVFGPFTYDWTFGQSRMTEPSGKVPQNADLAYMNEMKERRDAALRSPTGLLSPDGRWALRGVDPVQITSVDAPDAAPIALTGKSERAFDEGPTSNSMTVSSDGRLLVWLVPNKAKTAGQAVRVFDLARGTFVNGPIVSSKFNEISWIGSHKLAFRGIDFQAVGIRSMTLDLDRPGGQIFSPPLCHAAPIGETGRFVGEGGADCHTGDCPAPSAVRVGWSPDCVFAKPHGLWIARSKDAGPGPGDQDDFSNPSQAKPLELPENWSVPDIQAVSTDGNLALGRSFDKAFPLEDIRMNVSFVIDINRWKIRSVLDTSSMIYFRPHFLSLGDATQSESVFAKAGTVLLSLGENAGETRLLNVFDVSTGAKLGAFKAAGGTANTVAGAAAGPGFMAVWRFAVSPDGEKVAILDLSGKTTMFDIATREPVGSPIQMPPNSAALAYDAVRPILWAQEEGQVIHAYGRDAGAELFAFYPLADDKFFVIDPQGRYDTNLPPDSPELRWQMPDAPLQSLAPQTFMRDFYTPDLMRNLLDCVGAATSPRCVRAFRPVPDLTKLNRVLPTIRSMRVTPLDAAHVTLSVEVAEGHDPGAPNRKTRSGVHDLRVFRNGKLVGQWPAATAAAGGGGVETWRRGTAVPGAASGKTARHAFTVAVALDDGAKPVDFAAYAFNDDRVKGETYAVRYTPPVASKPGPRRAFVIAVGIDAYAPLIDHALNFAADDARAVLGALSRVPCCQVVPVALTAERGKPSAATKSTIRATLALLAGKEGDNRARLAAAGIDASRLTRATPDDVVIVSFSGHGWADAQGNFYLLPSDALLPDDVSERARASLISSAELTAWLRGVDAGEMAIIIDACHSAASVAAGGFRPGPMGDPGLGQLAFDKGIRILAATQGDAVALESARLHGGLLTYALVHDGLGDSRRSPKADHDAGGQVRLDALLKYALKAMPDLLEQTRPGYRRPAFADARGPLLIPREALSAPPPIQQPSLFDFTGAPSPVSVQPPRRSDP